MRDIREINDQELDGFIDISAKAYPGIKLADPANRERFRTRLTVMGQDPTVHYLGLFEDQALRGVMRWHDFTMNFRGRDTLVGGLGGVAVDLLHKKEKIAADMVRAFHRHYIEAGACLAALYPFRPDFYRRMGYGFGAPMYSYRFQPASLPRGVAKSDVAYLGRADIPLLEACYGRYQQRRHGLMARPTPYWQILCENPANLIVGVLNGDRLSGYLIFRFEEGAQDHFLSNNIFIRELVYETAADLRQLLTFLHTQADQVEHVLYNTHDESFAYLLHDPRNGSGRMLPQVVYHEVSTQGLGIMFRVIDVRRLFDLLQDHDFNGRSCRLQLDLRDSFLPENGGSYMLEVSDGRAHLSSGQESTQLTLGMDIAEFSSLIMGAIDLRTLVRYGLARLSDMAALENLDRLFAGPKPVCLTSF